MQEKDSSIPHYYKRTIKGVTVTGFDIIDAWELNYYLGCVLKYILRAGKKTTDRGPDLSKARSCLDHEITD